MTTVSEVLNILFSRAPRERAMPWDNVGLLCGDKAAKVETVFVCLDATNETLEEAAAAGANLVVTHHPLIFHKLSSLDFSDPAARRLAAAIKQDLAVISMHTNFDLAENGVSFLAARALGIQNPRLLKPEGKETVYKIHVTAPADVIEPLRRAMTAAGGGEYGEKYDCCTFLTAGLGTFRAREGANPYLGTVGELAREKEEKLEMIVKKENLSAVLNALKKAHPYEVPAYDIFPDEIGALYGLVAVGDLEREMSEEEFLTHVKKSLGAPGLKYAPAGKKIRTVAVAGGACGDLLRGIEADAFVTAEIKHHEWILAREKGILAVDAGHYTTERMFCTEVAALLKEKLSGVSVLISESERAIERYYI